MKTSLLMLTAAGTLAVTAPAAEAAPGGCLKYGAAGAAAGHMMHHGIRGAIAGCAAGMYRRHLYNKKMREQRAAPNGQPI